MKVGVKVIRAGAILPSYATERSACADLRANITAEPVQMLNLDNKNLYTYFGRKPEDSILLPPGCRALIPTGLIFDIPTGYSLRVHPRSGLSFKLGLTVVCGEGVIDEDYQEELFIPVINHSEKVLIIKNEDRIAQIELVRDERCDFGQIEELSDKDSSRTGGFGHTGTR